MCPGRTVDLWWAWVDLNHRPRSYQECDLRSIFAAIIESVLPSTSTKSRPFGQVEAGSNRHGRGSGDGCCWATDSLQVDRNACSLQPYAGDTFLQGVESQSGERASKTSVRLDGISCLAELAFSDRPEWHQSRPFDSRGMSMIMPPSSGLYEG